MGFRVLFKRNSSLYWSISLILTTYMVSLKTSVLAFTHPNLHEPCVYRDSVFNMMLDIQNEPNYKRIAQEHIDEVEQSLEVLYPTIDLEKRNSLSRTDGYWKFVSEGMSAPKSLTYGEFDIEFFSEILDRTAYHFNTPSSDSKPTSTGWDGKVFADFGSGAGRLVFGAAALNPNWKLCKGIEILPGIHELALENLGRCHVENVDDMLMAQYHFPVGNSEDKDQRKNDQINPTEFSSYSSSYAYPLQPLSSSFQSDFRDELDKMLESNDVSVDFNDRYNDNDDDDSKLKSSEYDDNKGLPLAPIEFICGSFDDPYVYIGDVDLVFCFSSCMPDGVIEIVSKAVGRCKPGTILVTTDYEPPMEGYLPPLKNDGRVPFGAYRLEKIESIEGACQIVGGKSVAHIYRVVQSTWNGDNIPRPRFSRREKARQLVELMESGKLANPDKFLISVHNAIMFSDIPDELRPNLFDS